MSRWEPNAHGRLTQAAMELFRERGFEKTTVEEIAARAGLTERTFFRYFTDKREVLFWGAKALEKELTEGVASAPLDLAPIDAVATSLESAAAGFEARRDFARARHALIAAHAELMERELIKLATLAAALTETLKKRGVPASAAMLAAEAGVAVLKIGFEQWVTDPKRRKLAHHLRAAFAELEAVTARKPSGRPARRSLRPALRARRSR